MTAPLPEPHPPTRRLADASADDHEDDRPIGRVVSRRELVATVGAVGLGMLFGCSTATPPAASASPSPSPSPSTARAGNAGDFAACLVRPQQTEGPFFVDGTLERSDIRLDPLGGTTPGVPLTIALQTVQLGHGATSQPLEDARIDMWHSDAEGRYSNPRDDSVPVPQRRFLRGFQRTDATGLARFTTIYPGWYHGRTVHIHIKVRWAEQGVHRTFTSQLYFPDALSDRIYAEPPYAHRGTRDRLNAQDGIFSAGGDQLMLNLAEEGSGFRTRFGIAMLDAIGQP